MTVRLDVPRPLSELAQMTGMAHWTIKRMLLALDRELHGTLLTKRFGPNRRRCTYYCTIANLRTVWPDFGKKFASRDDVDALREEVSEVRRNTLLLAGDIGQIRSEVRAMKRAG